MTETGSGETRVIAGKYRLVDLLGRGGMGSVWRAEHLALKSMVAVKLVEPALMQHPDALARFMREAQAAAALRSPHVVQILDHGIDTLLDQGVRVETPYIVMELLEGESLARRLERERRLSPAATAEIIGQVCRAVARAHEHGVVHRDLKPDNIFLTSNDDCEVAKVLDFGIAKQNIPDTHGMTQTGTVLGTPYYMSPEQAEGARDVDFRSDIWALSVIAYECIVGRRPFDEESIGALVLAICTRPLPVPSERATVPSGFDAWFLRGVARDKSQRFQSARELAHALRQIAAGEAVAPGPVPTTNADVVRHSGAVAALTPADRRNRTSVAGNLSRSVEPEPTVPPMNRWLSPRAGLVIFLGLCVAATGLWLARGAATDTSAVHRDAASSAPANVPTTAPAHAPAAVPAIHAENEAASVSTVHAENGRVATRVESVAVTPATSTSGAHVQIGSPAAATVPGVTRSHATAHPPPITGPKPAPAASTKRRSAPVNVDLGI